MNKNDSPGGNSASTTSERSIGDIIRQTNNLTPDQVEKVLSYQREYNLKFGEAAVALGFAKREDVLWALAQQFNYPYSAAGNSSTHEELVVANHPFSEQAEVFRDFRSQIISQVFSRGSSKALAVVSVDSGDGKTFFAANLAVAFSQLGGRTLLIDADMRTPRQHEIFGIENSSSGLSGILSGRAEPNVIRPVDALPSLYVLPVGVAPPNPLELVQRPTFALLLKELSTKFDYIIVDTPAAVHGSDARVIAGACGTALALGRRGDSRLAPMNKLIQDIKKVSGNVLGVVVNEHGHSARKPA